MLWTRSGPAPASTALHLRWRASGHCLTGSLRPARHCTAPALRAGPSGCRGQGGALSQAPLCGPPRGRNWEENCLGHCRGLPPPGRGRWPAWVAAATCTHSWIWTQEAGTCTASLQPQHGSPVSGGDSPVPLKLQPVDLMLKCEAYISQTYCWVLPAGLWGGGWGSAARLPARLHQGRGSPHRPDLRSPACGAGRKTGPSSVPVQAVGAGSRPLSTSPASPCLRLCMSIP